MRTIRHLVAALAMGAALAACGRGAAHEPLDAHAEPLRSTFNNDAGAPRILILVAPT